MLPSAPPIPLHRPLLSRRRLTLALITIFLLAPLVAWLLRPTAVMDLGVGERLAHSGMLAGWAHGDIIVLIRHAERCDRSGHACQGDVEGITRKGRQTAARVGAAFASLGLRQTDILSSTAVRTVQTTQAMFEQPVVTQAWLYACLKSSRNLLENVMAHKNTERNLILVTHSECMDELQEQLGVAGADTFDNPYASALFLRIDEHGGKPHLLGTVNAQAWRTLTLPSL